jgi:hypothetical protein
VLGCGEHRLVIAERGGAPIAEIDWTTLSYGRVLDGWSTATVQVGADMAAGCCDVLAEVAAWSHELHVYRDGELAWCGPVITPTPFRDGFTILARDLFMWFERRSLPVDRDFVDVDLAEIWRQLAADALAEDPSPAITVVARTAGVTGSRAVVAAERKRAADELREVARSGVDFTAVGRQIRVGPEPSSAEPLLLPDDAFGAAEAPEDGLAAATHYRVLAGFTADGTIEGVAELPSFARTGLLEHVESDPSITDERSANLSADARLQRAAVSARTFAGTLTDRAPVEFDELVPGRLCDLRVALACRDVVDVFRLADVTVTASAQPGSQSESVSVTFLPRAA